jgi:phenylacetate-CoA ligase
VTSAGGLLVQRPRGQLYLGLQRLRGHPLGPSLRQLVAWERLTPVELQRLHDERLREALLYASDHVPFYRNHWWRDPRGSQANPLDTWGSVPIGRPNAVEAWPVLEREVLRERAADLRARPHRPGTVERRTSGSSGGTVSVALTREAETWTWAHRYRMLMWHGVALGAPALRLSHDRHVLRDGLLGHIHLPELAGPDAFAEAAHVLRRERPPLVMGPPSTLFQLARYLREIGVTEPLARVARVGGERTFAFQRAEIEAVLAMRVVDAYGCTEIGAIAGECPAGALHVYTEHVHLEVLRGDAPAGPGELADVVLTSLANPAMPLVRYRVGDQARLSTEPCRCGLPHPVLAELRPRSADTVLAPDGSRRPASVLVEPLGEFYSSPAAAGVRNVQFEQIDPRQWWVWVEAPALLGDGSAELARPGIEAGLGAIVRGALGPECRLEARLVERIERPRGKFRYYR